MEFQISIRKHYFFLINFKYYDKFQFFLSMLGDNHIQFIKIFGYYLFSNKRLNVSKYGLILGINMENYWKNQIVIFYME
jgi:hypothetical protein